MDRKTMIEALIENELLCLVDNYDKHSLSELVDFFAEGGFESWTDKELMNKYDALFGDEDD